METRCLTGFDDDDDDDDDGTICMQCGDKGFANAFVYCVRCLGFAVHRYCLDVIPETFDEFVRWICDDCEAKVQNVEAVQSQARDFTVSNSTKQFSGVETKKNNLLVVQTEENGSEHSYNDFECGEEGSEVTFPLLVGKKDKADERKIFCEDEKAENNLMEHSELSDGTPKRKKKKNRTIQESDTEKEQCKVVNDECTKVECGEKASEGSLMQLVEKKNKSDERKIHHKSSWRQPEDEKAEDNLMDHAKSSDGSLKKKKKKKRKIQEPDMVKNQRKDVNDDCRKVECGVKPSEDTFTQSGGKKDKSDEGKGHQKISSELPEDEKAKDNLMEHVKLSDGEKRKKKRKIRESDTEPGQGKLDNNDCTKIECCEKAKQATFTQSGHKKDKEDEKKRFHKNSSQQPQDEKAKDNLMEHAKSSDGEKRKKKRKIRESDTEKGQGKLVNNDCTKVECCEKAKEATFTQSGGKKDKEDEKKRFHKNSSQQPQDEKAKDNLMKHAKLSNGEKRKKKRKIRESDTEKGQGKLVNNDCTKVECKKAKEATFTQLGGKKDKEDEKKRFHKNSSQQPKDEKVKDNLMDHAKLSDGGKKKKKRKIRELDTENDQCELVNKSSKRSFVERVKVDITEPARLASDSTSPSKVRENEVNPIIPSKQPLESVKKKIIVGSSEITVKEQMHRSVSPQPLPENNSENQFAEERNFDHIDDTEELEDGEKKTKTSAPLRDKIDILKDDSKDLHISSAEPISMTIWRGSFNIWNQNRDILDGLVAHLSSKACQKVCNEASKFQTILHLEIVPKTDVWPKSFKTLKPSGDNIALYFFPTKISERDFDNLVEEMKEKDLALKAFVQNAELLIFNSTELPLLYWRFQDKNYLWGVFRAKQSTPPHSHPFSIPLYIQM